jgi:flagellar biosynthesis anti-sigma factor FlgM
MKINDAARLAQMKMYQSTGRVKDKGTTSPGAEMQRDGVSISKAAMEMARESQETTAERAERLEAVKNAVRQGSYSVEPDRVVRKMLEAYGDFE